MKIPEDYEDIFPDLNMESDDDLPSYKFAGEEDNASEDTESESEQEMPEKKQRTDMFATGAVQGLQYSRQPPGPNAGDAINDTLGVTGARRVPSDEAADAETPAGRSKAELQSLFRTSTVRRILDELSKRKEFQMPKNRRDR